MSTSQDIAGSPGIDGCPPSSFFALERRHFFPRYEDVHELAGRRRGMQQVIERYGLRRKSVISFGAGRGFDEYWLFAAECRLMLVDRDRDGKMRRQLGIVGTPLQEPDISRDLTYVLSEADGAGWLSPIYDLCMITGELATGNQSSDVFLQPTLSFAAKAVVSGGLLMLNQSATGPSLPGAHNYLNGAAKELASKGFSLIEVLYPKNRPSQHVFVALKGTASDARQYMLTLSKRRAVSELTFDGVSLAVSSIHALEIREDATTTLQ